MSNIPISSLPSATLLGGQEDVPIVQGGTTKRTTVGAISSLPLGVATSGISFVTISSATAALPNSRVLGATSPVVLTDGGAGSTAIFSLVTVPVSFGGTGTTTLTSNRLLLGNGTSPVSFVTNGTSGTVLTSNGTGSAPTFQSLPTFGTGSVTSVALSGGTTGLTISGSPITVNGTMTIGGTLAVVNGGTGVTTSTGTGSVVLSNTPSLISPLLTTPSLGVAAGSALTVPLIIGGSGAASSLSLQSTSGVGSTDFIRALVGNNGATEAWRVLTDGKVILGGTTSVTQAGALTPLIQIYGTATAASFSVVRQGTPGGGGALVALTSSRSSPSTGLFSALQTSDGIGSFVFAGDTGSSINNQAASVVAIAGASFSPSGTPGIITLQTTPTNATATVERMRIDHSGNVLINTGAIATNATAGFLYIETCAGTATGTPGSFTGRAPLVYDSTNNRLWIFNGSWRSAVFS